MVGRVSLSRYAVVPLPPKKKAEAPAQAAQISCLSVANAVSLIQSLLEATDNSAGFQAGVNNPKIQRLTSRNAGRAKREIQLRDLAKHIPFLLQETTCEVSN
jgi:hypothetical protein